MAYLQYKPSDFDLLEDIPNSWITYKLKYVALIEMGQSPPSSDYNLHEIGLPFLQGNADFGSLNPIPSVWCETANKIAREDDILLSVRAPVGQINIADQKYGIGRGLCAIRPSHKLLKNFLWYMLHYVRVELIAHATGSTYDAVSIDDVRGMTVCVPSLIEQQNIADFLDQETVVIDMLIARKRELIKRLQEKRAALISHTVTKGLDPTVPMKDSGLPWIGTIPSHWQIIKTKYLFRLCTEKAPDDNDYELLSLYTEIGVKPRQELEQKGNKATTTDGYWIVRKGDIIVNKLLAWMGAIGRSEYNGVTSPAYDILRNWRPLDTKYYHFLFRCGLYLPEFRRRSRGIMDMRLRLYFDEFGQIPLLVPPLEEQKRIVEALDRQNDEIEALIVKIIVAIDRLQEYRTALISAAVTGKIDVRTL